MHLVERIVARLWSGRTVCVTRTVPMERMWKERQQTDLLNTCYEFDVVKL